MWSVAGLVGGGVAMACGVGVRGKGRHRHHHHHHHRHRPCGLRWGFTRPVERKAGGCGGRASFSGFASASLPSLAAASLTHPLHARLLRQSVNASFKLVAACTLVVWMQKSGQLPSETPSVLSQVSYNLLIPCFLMSKVIEAITSSSGKSLIMLPILAVIQVLVGTFAGKFACRLMYEKSNRTVALSAPIVEQASYEIQQDKSLSYVKMIDSSSSKHVTPTESLIVAACAFGNSITLPLVLLSGVLSPEDFNNVIGYLALFTVGWSSCLWSLGYQIIRSANSKNDVLPASYKSKLQFSVKWISQFLRPPLYGALAGLLIGATPISYLFLPATKSQHLVGVESKINPSAYILHHAAGLLHPVMQGAALLGSATLAIQTVILASTLANSISFTNQKDKNTIPCKDSQLPEDTNATSDMSGLEVSLEPKAFWIIFLIRLLFMPLMWLILVHVFQKIRWLPSDPLPALAVLVVSAMPTAQNLVVLAQLEPNTRPLAGILAELLMKQYILSIIPLTFWMVIFLAFLRVG